MIKVLVIEDNSDNSRLAEKILGKSGFDCRIESTAAGGLKSVLSYAPDIVLLDISLPGMDGLTAARLMKSNDAISHIPVIALTAHAMSEDRTRALEAGCDDFLSKPYRSAELIEMVRRHTHA